MPNLYGVANPNPPPVAAFCIGGANVNIPAGVETNFISTAAPLPTLPGLWYPQAFGWFTIAIGATAPTFLNAAFRLNNGADLETLSVYVGSLVANASPTFPISFAVPSQVMSNPTGTWNFQVSLTVGVNATTVTNLGTLYYLQWVRATDQ